MFRLLLRTSHRLSTRQNHGFINFRALSCAPIEAKDPQPPAPTKADLDGGVVLARMTKMALTLKDAIESEHLSDGFMPETLLELEQDVASALDLTRRALDKAGRPCTVEELADRTTHNVLPIPSEALGFKEFLKASAIRDDMEMCLVNMDVFPPADAQLDGTGLPFSKRERRKELRRRRRAAAGLPADPADEPEDEDGAKDKLVVAREGRELTELRPITLDELQRRKEYLEKSTSMDAVLAGYDTALLEVGRVHKVVKAGTTMSMRALVVIGNRNGVAGYGEGKSDTVQHAIERACRDAKRNMLPLDLYEGRTIYHRTNGKFVKSLVSLWPAPRGSGISSNNHFSAIFQLFGIKDIGAKLHGPRSLMNAVKALFNALANMETPQSVAERRGLTDLPANPKLYEFGIRAKKIRSW